MERQKHLIIRLTKTFKCVQEQEKKYPYYKFQKPRSNQQNF